MSDFKIPKPNLFDRAIIGVMPRYGVNRMKARAEAALYEYQAAHGSVSRNSPQSRQDPRGNVAQTERNTITRLARNLVENFPIVTGIMRKMGPYAIGDLRYEACTGDEDLDHRLEDLLGDDFRQIDVTGRHDLTSMMNIALVSMLMDGDVASSPVFVGDDVRYELIESDCIGNPNMVQNNRFHVSGINLDALGRPITYNIYRRNIQVGGSYEYIGEYGADLIDMMYDTNRYSEYRGVSAFAASIRENQDLREILDAGRDRVKFAACLTAIVTNKDGAISKTDAWRSNGAQTVTNDGRILENTTPGLTIYQAHGDGIQAFANQFPEQTVDKFLRLLIQIIANSLNLPYGFVFDLSALGGPGARYEATQVQRQFEWWQRIVRERILRPLVARLIFNHAASGRLGDVNPFTRALYCGNWMFPAKISIDGRDERIEIEGIRAGTNTLKQYCADRQIDWKEHQDQVIRERKRGIDRAQEEGIVPIDQSLVTPSGQVPNSVPVGEGEKSDPLITTIGIGGVQAMTEIVASVGRREMQPESAIAMLVSVFGLDETEARKIIVTPPPVPAAATK